MDNDKSDYVIDRKAASKLLKVSLRTLDRYVKAKRLSTVLVDGRIWLSREELMGFSHDFSSRHEVDKGHVSTPRLSIDNRVDNVDKTVDTEVDRHDNVDIYPQTKQGRTKIYKKLYLELKEELKEKQDRLEIANYRVGQLETQVRNSVPLLEYHRDSFEKEKVQKELSSKLEEAASQLHNASTTLRYERLTKRIFMIVLLTLLALQPLWLLLINSFQ